MRLSLALLTLDRNAFRACRLSAFPKPENIIVPPEVIDEARRAYAWIGGRSIVAEPQGDPLPGRSAIWPHSIWVPPLDDEPPF
jgi:hypothetical protein